MPSPSSQTFLALVSGGATDKGLRRSKNEDCVLIREDLGLFLIADGAGGHNAGNVASALATATVAEYLDDTEDAFRESPDQDQFGLWTGARRLVCAVQQANLEVVEAAQVADKYRGMGTTIVAMLASLDSKRLHLGYVGDSRCYRLRGGFVDQMSQDHSVLNDVMELRPELPDEVIAKLPRKAVTRALGMAKTVRVSLQTLQLAPGDRYMLCSDGLSNELNEKELFKILSAGRPPQATVRDLIDAANESGGRDNIAALVIDVKASTERPLRAKRSVVAHRPVMSSMPEISISSGGSQSAIRRPPLTIPDVSVRRAAESARSAEAPGSTSEPEMLIRNPVARHVESDPRISVVPADSVSTAMARAVDSFVASCEEGQVRCISCGDSYDRNGAFCPHCGDTTEGPPRDPNAAG